MKTTTTALVVKCSLCGKRALAYLHHVQLPDLPAAPWLKMPSGWWALLMHRLVDDPSDPPHVRCPKCLRADLKKARAV